MAIILFDLDPAVRPADHTDQAAQLQFRHVIQLVRLQAPEGNPLSHLVQAITVRLSGQRQLSLSGSRKQAARVWKGDDPHRVRSWLGVGCSCRANLLCILYWFSYTAAFFSTIGAV